MYVTPLAVLIAISLGLMAGSGIGLLIGFLAGTQKRPWSAMDRRGKLINLSLIAVCSLVAIAVFSWYSLFR